ncbi:nucleotidyl transferase AbiEii/AbiGii toxin family protein [Desulforhopalus sp. IMCC35007]|uniref:nucleotidyl transferase AbiEii/AbiGii toxin family protein n=1 Tax=Desulforhopalus sp. IMCC35007 TaxID=2569543 RepID=UPI0010AE50F0|nr:nucleotidyl transferase AbiEii/AbiGii toxin family protein [Desulforhopalus sp. IMCC35007]TKB08838.1 nucleotidyl transferase AbiEii/AbiGii toxin family protein [Desulforhopalus sp. IMCC35007]
MKISHEKLITQAEATGFRPDVLEKVAHLLGLLEALGSHPFLKGKLALKGGTALNLFIFKVPRLSVDIDLNYVGEEDREAMLAERPRIEQAVQAVFAREGFTVRRMPEEHAGGKWSLRYQSAAGLGGNLEVDLNFMYRVPLWPVRLSDSYPVGTWQANKIPVIDIHELAAGKLAALLARRQARDLFDSHRILHKENLDQARLRIAFVVYGAMNRKDWRKVSVEDVNFENTELARQLIPTLRATEFSEQELIDQYGARLVEECRQALSVVLPFSEKEKAFLDLLLEQGEIDSTILTADSDLQQRIQRQPLLEWKAVNVRKYKGL